MPGRTVPLSVDEVYHICTKSIAGFEIFRCRAEYLRMLELLKYYKYDNNSLSYSAFLKTKDREVFCSEYLNGNNRSVNLIAYCIMPTHIHLILQQIKENGIPIFMSKVLNSYARYFNIKIRRKGHLWESKYKNVHVKTDDQFMHLTRYIHLNPVTQDLVLKPEDWEFSSYKEFIGKNSQICDTCTFFDCKPSEYRKFVESHIEKQKELAIIKHLMLE